MVLLDDPNRVALVACPLNRGRGERLPSTQSHTGRRVARRPSRFVARGELKGQTGEDLLTRPRPAKRPGFPLTKARLDEVSP